MIITYIPTGVVFTIHFFYPLFVKFVAIKKANDQLQEKL